MGVQAWRELWTLVFIVASVAFYGVVVIVGVRGMADVKEMVGAMWRCRGKR